MASQETPEVSIGSGDAPDKGLKRNAVGLGSVLSQSLANVGPTIGILFVTGLVVSKAGASAPFNFILVTVGLGFTAWSVAVLCRYMPSASVLYAGPARAFGGNTGLVIAAGLFLIYMLETAATVTFVSGLLQAFISQHTGVSIAWWLILIIILAVYAILGWVGIHLTLRTTIVFLACELTLILILSTYILIHGGHSGQVPSAFGPSLSPTGWHGIGAGFVFGIFALGGFESSAGTAEETRNPRRYIPIAVIGAVLMGGVLFIYNSYAMIVGYGSHNLASLMASSNPMVPLATTYIGGWYADLIQVALITASIGASLASATLGFRLVYSLGRDGVLPRALGRTHPRYRTPYVAVVSLSVFCLIVGLVIGAKWGAEGQYGITGYLTGVSLGIAYLIFNIAMGVFVYRWYRQTFNIWIYAVPATIGAVIVIIGLVPSFRPFPAWPDSLMLYILIAYIVLAAIGVIIWSKLRPGSTNQIRATAIHAEDSVGAAPLVAHDWRVDPDPPPPTDPSDS
jgi:amino acid transporter